MLGSEKLLLLLGIAFAAGSLVATLLLQTLLFELGDTLPFDLVAGLLGSAFLVGTLLGNSLLLLPLAALLVLGLTLTRFALLADLLLTLTLLSCSLLLTRALLLLTLPALGLATRCLFLGSALGGLATLALLLLPLVSFALLLLRLELCLTLFLGKSSLASGTLLVLTLLLSPGESISTTKTCFCPST